MDYLYLYNKLLIVEHNLCVLPWVMYFYLLFSALWSFIENPDIKLIIVYIKTFILGTSLTYLNRYNYVLCWIELCTNLRCQFILSLISIPYMTYNTLIRHYWYVSTMPFSLHIGCHSLYDPKSEIGNGA